MIDVETQKSCLNTQKSFVLYQICILEPSYTSVIRGSKQDQKIVYKL